MSLFICFNTLAENDATINKLIQDEQGFIWLFGQQGSSRFDGKNSIKFSTQNSQYYLPFNWVNDAAVQDDNLLLTTETHGLWSLNPKTGKARKFPIKALQNNIDGIDIFKNNYYLQSSGKIYKYQPSNQKTVVISSSEYFLSIQHTNKHLYASSRSGLFRLRQKSLSPVIKTPIKQMLPINETLIAISDSHIYAFNDSGDTIKVALESDAVRAVKEYGQDNFFTINSQGVIKKYTAKTLKEISHNFTHANAVRVRSMLHDNSGVLWLASNQGIQKLTENENKIANYPKIFDININANEIALFNDNIIIGSYGAGLKNLNKAVFNKQTNNNFTDDGLKISHLISADNKLFIATFDGLWFFEQKTNQVSKVSFDENNKLLLKLATHQNQLYIATNYNGFYIYDFSYKNLIANITTEKGLSSNEVIDVLPLDSGKIWLTTAQGVDIYDIHADKVNTLDIPRNSKFMSVISADNKIFATSFGHGVFVFNQQGELLTNLGQGIRFTGLILYEDEIWATAKPGLYRLSPQNYELAMIENTEEYSFIGSSLIHNNTLYSSHYGGILTLDLTKKAPFHPKVYISQTTVSGKSYLLNKTINISNSNDVITLDLASLDYRPGLAKKYKYRINNHNWQQINGEQLTLTGLASGEYNIEIMATNSLGQWSEHKAFTDINVAYPWYWSPQIRIAYLILLLCISVLTAWLLYLRSSSIGYIYSKLKNEVSHSGKKMQHLHRNLQLAITLLDENKVEQSKALLEKNCSELIKNIHEKEPDSLSGKSLMLAIPFFSDYVKTKYRVIIQSKVEIRSENLNDELQAEVYKIIFEAISSSILNSDAQKFTLTLQEVNKKLWLTISDDCQSFKHFDSKVAFDMASYTIRQIVNKNKGAINIFDGNDNGSQLIISIPLMEIRY